MKTNWKKLINPDYLGAYSLDDGEGKYRDITATIRQVRVEQVTGPDGKKENCPVAHFVENIKPMILNVTNMKTLEKLFHSKYIEDWSGRRVQIGVESVRAFGDVVDALRIRRTLPREGRETGAPLLCTDCGKPITPAALGDGREASAEQIAALARKRHGVDLCADCLKRRKEAQNAEAHAESEGQNHDADK